MDVLVALAGASCALSGMVVANASYAILSLAGGLLSFQLLFGQEKLEKSYMKLKF